jgi:hypothetical protein
MHSVGLVQYRYARETMCVCVWTASHYAPRPMSRCEGLFHPLAIVLDTTDDANQLKDVLYISVVRD